MKLRLTARLLELQLCHIQLKLAQTWLPHRTHVNGKRLVPEKGNLNQSEKADQQLLIKLTLTTALGPPWCSESSILHRNPCEKASEERLLPPTCEIYPGLLLDHWICIMRLLTVWHIGMQSVGSCAYGIELEPESVITEVHAKMLLSRRMVHANTVCSVLGKPLCMS